MADSPLAIVAWNLLGLAAAAVFLAYAKSFGRARRRFLAYGLVIAAIIYATAK